MNDIERAYTQHAKDVYRYLLSLSHNEDLAEDLTQETFFRAIRTMSNYDGSCKLSVWLCQIAKHIWYQWLEKHSRFKQVEFNDDMPGYESPERSTLLRMEKTALYKAIHSLPEPMRELVHMRLTGEFTFAEIGEILGKNENWARTMYYRSKQKIMKEMEKLT
ncbi:RNA polymerase sigma factor [Lacrimispora defluvii]|uniref:RNA polymerase sigma factor n=1 Tax=Lacrimispora defluvii TaxID=2719233 RepID=UPI002D1E37A3|nr:sigma-70 family RNA polymerase sigma factor [Lacrimispora defluvii]